MGKLTDDFLKNIKSKHVKAELYSHIYDKIEKLVEDGKSFAQAEEIAVSQMGNPKQIARKLYWINLSPLEKVMYFCVIAGCVLAVLTVVYIGSNFNMGNDNLPESFSVIGGADGPTAIYITTDIFTLTVLFPFGSIAFFATALIIYIIVRKKQK